VEDDDDRADMRKIKVQNWSNMAMDREGQKRIIEQHSCSAKRRTL
jgi:hypothetical protein